jgi:hypothetical protein
MKRRIFYFVILASIGLCGICCVSIYFLMRGAPRVHHADPFYDFKDSEFPRNHLPVINPVEATRERSDAPWELDLLNVLWIELPKSQEQEVRQVYGYTHVDELEQLAVKDGVIMAYSPYVDQQADPYIKNNFYHWFVMVVSQNITKGFHTEEEFRQYIQTLSIQNPNWQTPDEAFDQYLETGGCLDWFPDCP